MPGRNESIKNESNTIIICSRLFSIIPAGPARISGGFMMNVQIRIISGMVFCIALWLFVAAPGYAEQAPGTEFQITNSDVDQVDPVISGDQIVWNEKKDGQYDIYLYTISTRQVTPVCTEPHNQYAKAIAGNRIAWVDDRNGDYNEDIYLYDIPTKNETRITTDGGEKFQVSFSGNRIAWES